MRPTVTAAQGERPTTNRPQRGRMRARWRDSGGAQLCIQDVGRLGCASVHGAGQKRVVVGGAVGDIVCGLSRAEHCQDESMAQGIVHEDVGRAVLARGGAEDDRGGCAERCESAGDGRRIEGKCGGKKPECAGQFCAG